MTCGNLCSGKSTYAEKLGKELRAVVLSIDELMTTVLGRELGDMHDEYFRRQGIDCEFHYIAVSNEEWERRIAARNAEVLNGRSDVYHIDSGLLEKFRTMFEEPDRQEMDMWIELKNSHKFFLWLFLLLFDIYQEFHFRGLIDTSYMCAAAEGFCGFVNYIETNAAAAFFCGIGASPVAPEHVRQLAFGEKSALAAHRYAEGVVLTHKVNADTASVPVFQGIFKELANSAVQRVLVTFHYRSVCAFHREGDTQERHSVSIFTAYKVCKLGQRKALGLNIEAVQGGIGGCQKLSCH